MLVFDEFGVRGARLLPPVPKPGIMAKGTPFCHGTIMMRAEAYKALGATGQSGGRGGWRISICGRAF